MNNPTPTFQGLVRDAAGRLGNEARTITSRAADKYALLGRLRTRVARYRPLKAWRLEGRERQSGHALRIDYVGRETDKNYLAHIAYGDNRRERYLGRVWNGAGPGAGRAGPDADLLVIETEENRTRDRTGFYIPFWVNGTIEVARDDEQIRQSGHIKADLRRIRKHGFRYEISKERDQFIRFYHEMYRPYISKAHGDRAVLMSYETMMKQLDHCELILIRQGDDYVAGQLLRYDRENVRAWSLGVKAGDDRHVRDGAIGALYYYKNIYLASRGLDRYHDGAARAFLHDGVLQYKKKRGLALTKPQPGGFWLRVLRESAGAKAFIRNNPFISRQDGNFIGRVFVDADPAVTPEMIDDLKKAYALPGLERLTISRLGEASPV